MRKPILVLAVALFCLSVQLPLAAQNAVTPKTLTESRWFNDEYSIDFAESGTCVSYYTQGPNIGTLKGTWTLRSPASVVITITSCDEQYNRAAFPGNELVLQYRADPQNPKATELLSGGTDGQLVLWKKTAFVAAYTPITLAPDATPCMTTGYQLTATTDNLRIRKGPGTQYEYLIYTYLDAATKAVKTHTSIRAGTNLRILARTRAKVRITQENQSWFNYWYYVEYKEPVGNMLVYRNAWMFGEFLNLEENKTRWVRISTPDNEAAFYGTYELLVKGTTAGSPVRLEAQIKDAYGNILRRIPISGYSLEQGEFLLELSKERNDLFIGSNTLNIVAVYSDNKTANKQITFYLHEYAGERAKPVIYLYPKKEMLVSVRVEPEGGLSVSDPPYGYGWNVVARPDGQIRSVKGDKTWPYLFWESKANTRPVTTSGFVVETAKLTAFFKEKLTILGLNSTEIADFLEFWIPILNQGPYYYISFIDQATQDAEAPLTVLPKPDSVIRVFFDSKPLEAPIAVPEQTLTTRRRTGFAVVEWGGMRYPD